MKPSEDPNADYYAVAPTTFDAERLELQRIANDLHRASGMRWRRKDLNGAEHLRQAADLVMKAVGL